MRKGYRSGFAKVKFCGQRLGDLVAEPRPAFGIMSVRVFLPGIGILAATDPVLADEPLLVDSNWP